MTRRRATTARRRKKSNVSFWNMLFGSTTKSKKSVMYLEIKESVLREIYAIVFTAIAILTILSINSQLGVVGDVWVRFLQPIFGWGIYVFPAVLFCIAFCLFFSEKIIFHTTKLVGIGLFFSTLLGLIHFSVDMNEIYSVAQMGEYGGYVGFVMSFLLKSTFGSMGTLVVYCAFIFISLLLVFEFSIGDILKSMTIKVQSKEDALDKEVDKVVMNKAEKLAFSKNSDLPVAGLKQAVGSVKSAFGVSMVKSVDKKGEPSIKIHKGNEVSNTVSKRKKVIPVQQDMMKVNKIFKDFKWEYPSMDLLDAEQSVIHASDEVLKVDAEKIRQKLLQFNVPVTMKDVHVGPTVVQFTLRPHEGVKLTKITSLKNDLAMALSAKSIRIEAPIPGKGLVGIELPTQERATVHLREIMESAEFRKIKSSLKMPLGRDVTGKPIIADLISMPHLLIAGTTGSGKSIAMNNFLVAMLYQNSPKDLKLILIDPKRVELTAYDGIPHLLTPVITNPEKAATALRWVVAEMNKRYSIMANLKQRNIDEFNNVCKKEDKMSRIVVVIDELADLMMAASKEVEASICRIAQMARAVGIHLIIATQRPSVDVITGLIKANVPARIAFAVASQIDSRTILDSGGAEDLLGKGDMLYLASGSKKLCRVQGIFVSTKEVERVTNRIKLTEDPQYVEEVTSNVTQGVELNGIPTSKFVDKAEVSGGDEELIERAKDVIRETRKASTSLLQRRLKLGYARAARILDEMEDRGYVGPSRGAKPREIFFE